VNRSASELRARTLALAGVFVTWTAILAAADVKTVTIFEGRQIEIPVPEGWSFQTKLDEERGVQTVELADPKKEVQLDVSFLPDPDGEMSTRKALEEQAKRIFVFYLSQSVEREMKLVSFEAAGGIGVSTTFTDRKLDPKHVPEGEKLMSTTGLRSWKGVYLIFTLLSDSKDSAAYRSALEIVQKGLKQVKAPASF